MRIPTVAAGLAAALLLTLSAAPAPAVFNKPISLKDDALREEFIFLASVESVAPDTPAMTLKVEQKLKGDFPFERMAVNLTGTAEAKKQNHTQVMLDRLEPGRQVLAFSSRR